MDNPKKINRALSFNEIKNFNPHLLDFSGKWFNSFGKPERTGAVLIWGNSGSGKTRFSWQFAKYLCNFGRVVYDSLEEGLSGSMQRAIFDVGMSEVSTRWQLLNREPIDDLKVRLRKKNGRQTSYLSTVCNIRD